MASADPNLLADVNKSIATATTNVNAGELRLEPGAAAAAAQACEQMIESLRDIDYHASRLEKIDGLSSFPVSDAVVKQRIEPTAQNMGSNSIKSVAQDHIDTLTKLRDMFLLAGKKFQEQDDNGKKTFDFDNLPTTVTRTTINNGVATPTTVTTTLHAPHEANISPAN